MTVQQDTQNTRPSFAFEHVAARLVPFDLMEIQLKDLVGEPSQIPSNGPLSNSRFNNSLRGISQAAKNPNQPGEPVQRSHPLFPIFDTGGLVFPYNPNISEGVSVKYDSIELVHSNESFHTYRGTENVKINISDAVWTCDTFDNALYALAALHFFRTYQYMDFGRNRSGRPPSPMWFSAYGNYMFHRVPVLMESASWDFPNDIDYVGIPEPGTQEFRRRELKFSRDSSVSYTWLPMTFKISSINLIVQHSPRYWTTWNLDDYRSGKMLDRRKSFHALPPGMQSGLKNRNNTG